MSHKQPEASDLTPEFLAQQLGKKFPPTPEQASVIAGAMEPLLVTAGAGAGKTETMASRVVSLVANGHVRPEQVLGLTFTRKAAQQLEQRIRAQLARLQGTGLFPPGSEIARSLETIVPKVSTYDSFAGDLVREFGLYIPVEPSARIITEAERYAIAHEVVANYRGRLTTSNQLATVVQSLLDLVSSMDNSLVDPEQIAADADDFIAEVDGLPKAPKTKGEYSGDLARYVEAQRKRKDLLPLVEELKAEQARRQVVTFGEQMAIAARLAQDHAQVGQALRQRFRVVMLDEYQDTSHAQRVLLRSLFGAAGSEGLSVTAVGDPMQAIYGWRGATAENLQAFIEDFPQADNTEAQKKQLTVSWRNPATVLEMANAVAADVFANSVDDQGRALPRPVDPLAPRPQAESGEVQLGYFATQEEEREFVARHMRQKYDEAVVAGEPFSAAVLVRKNRHSTQIAQALEAQGVPCEIVGIGGLLWEPEIQDLLAIATMLVRPMEYPAALRILSGPLCGLGLKDLLALDDRVANMNGKGEGRLKFEPGTDPIEFLRAQLDELSSEAPDMTFGLTDAVADLGERERYTEQGLTRIETLAANLRHLRQYSLQKSLPDLFADIEATFNIRTEVLARGSAGGTTHLDAFADAVAAYHGTSLTGLLDYLELVREKDNGLDPGPVPAAQDRVLILTAHRAKGLEWEHVSVLHADSTTYKAETNCFITKADKVQPEDAVIEVEPTVTAKGEVKELTRKDFQNGCEAILADDRRANAEESARLFYVAITRTEKSLTVTGGGTDKRGKMGPYTYLELLAEKFPEQVVEWTVLDAPPEENEQQAAETALFPQLRTRAETVAGARQVAAASAELPPLREGEVYSQWENEASALIEEYRLLSAPVVDVELPSELTASDVVSIKADPLQFARRQRRPVPFKPNSYAKRGTAFHSWLEERFGAASLLGAEELPGNGEELEDNLAELQDKFLYGQWANRTPTYVEAPFEITVGPSVVRGRIDAVFQEPDGSWLVVDWKTGRRPNAAEMRAAQMQLAVYREAWRRIHGDSQPVRAAFYYVSDDYTYEPDNLPEGEELVEILRRATGEQR